MIKYFTLDNEKLRNTGKETDQTIWYCVERPNQEEIHQLTHQFEIPSDYITSILDDADFNDWVCCIDCCHECHVKNKI